MLFLTSGIKATAAPTTKPEAPTKIRSDIIDIKRKSQTINFLHNVVVEKEDSTLLAQKMTVFYEDEKSVEDKPGKDVDAVENETDSTTAKKNSAKKGTKIKRIDAADDVKIFTQEFVAKGEIGHYDPEKDIFVLEKNVIVNNGGSVANGDKFVYDLKTKKGNFVGKQRDMSPLLRDEDNRVVVVIRSDAKEQQKEQKNSKKKSKAEINDQDIKR